MRRTTHLVRCGLRGWAALLLTLLLTAGGCGTGSYNDGLEQRIQELKSAPPEASEEETEEPDASAGRDEQPEDDALDEVPEEDVPEEDPGADEEPPEDDVPEINEPL